MAEAAAIFLISSFIGAAAAGGTVLAVTTAAIQIGAAFAVGALAQAFLTPKAARGRAADRQFIQKAPIVPRVRHYGRVMVSGAQMFCEASGSKLYRVLVHGDGKIDAIEEHWLDDLQIELDGNGDVTTNEFVVGGVSRVHVETWLGGDEGKHYATLQTVFPEWDQSHRGKGMHHSLTVFTQVAAEQMGDVFPKFENTVYKVLIRAALVFDPREVAHDPEDAGTWEWSKNPALCIMDYLRHESGLQVPYDWIGPELTAWEDAADACDVAYDLKDGGTEPRFSISGSYGFDERRVDVLNDMLLTCDGRLMLGANGGLRLSVPGADTATVTITDSMIIEYEAGSGNEAPDTATVVKATYLDPDNQYTEAEAQPWVNGPLVPLIGETTVTANLNMVPSHAQARRLMKVAAARLAPDWRGRLRLNLYGLVALGERYLHLQITEMDLDIQIEVETIEFVIGSDSTVIGLDVTWVSVKDSDFSWNPSTEEGTPPRRRTVKRPRSSAESLPGFTVMIIADGSDIIARAVWLDATGGGAAYLGYDVDTYEFRWRIPGTDTPDGVRTVAVGTETLDSAPLVAGETYEFTARALLKQYAGADTDPPITLDAVVDLSGPSAPTALTFSGFNAGASAGASVTWAMPSSQNVAYAVLEYRISGPSPWTFVSRTYGNYDAPLGGSVNSGLLYDTSYDFRVTPYNAADIAGTSATVTGTTPT